MSPADSDNEQLQHYAQTIRDLRISHEAGHAVLAEYFGYELRNVITEAVVASPEGATGGSTEIVWNQLDPNGPDFDERLQDVATVLMGGRAAEESTHPHLARSPHWDMDVLQFKEPLKELRTEAEMEAILEEGYQRAKTLLSSPGISEQYNRLRCFLATEPHLQQPNGRFLCRVMKGLSS